MKIIMKKEFTAAGEMVEKLLTQYIQFLYDQEALDIETPIAKITSSHKKAI